MFVYIEHGENNNFLVNTYCPVILLLLHIRTRLGLAESELIDLCDTQGEMKFLFLSQNAHKWANELLKPRASFIVCSINHTSDGAYRSVTSLLANIDSALLEALQVQIDIFETTRLKQLRGLEAPSAPSGKSIAHVPPKTSKKGRLRK